MTLPFTSRTSLDAAARAKRRVISGDIRALRAFTLQAASGR